MNVIITGGSGGLGSAIIKALTREFQLRLGTFNIIDWSHPHVDVTMSADVYFEAKKAPEKIDILINCAGINRINYLPNVEENEFDMVMDTNSREIYTVTKALLEKLRGGTVLNIVSNAAHVPMTSSAAYNASKAAALMLTKSMARELIKTHNITVFSVSPNKLAGTGMSRYIDDRVQRLRGWTKEQAEAYQLAALPAGEETDPETLGEFIAFLLSTKQRHKYLAGCDITYGGP
jgi:2,3-dihydro-2,3-dihydroxybenzoate dehydrogenase